MHACIHNLTNIYKIIPDTIVNTENLLVKRKGSISDFKEFVFTGKGQLIKRILSNRDKWEGSYLYTD